MSKSLVNVAGLKLLERVPRPWQERKAELRWWHETGKQAVHGLEGRRCPQGWSIGVILGTPALHEQRLDATSVGHGLKVVK